MRSELKELGLSIDWSREFATCDLAYYGQQQALFLDLFKQGLVYRKEGMVNWDPVDLTVLANEQVVDGRGWRSGAVVEKRKLNQWFLRITDYADQLTDDLAALDRWPDKVRVMQENWIGRSRGAQFVFAFAGGPPSPEFAGGLHQHIGEVIQPTRLHALGVRAGEQQEIAHQPAHPLGRAQRRLGRLGLLAVELFGQ